MVGDRLISEYDYYGTMTRRYIHGPGTDEPLVWYEGAGTGSRRWLHADERGSIIALSDQSGAVFGYNAYDEYGRSTSSHPMPLFGRFGYTGQAWLPEIGMYYYKARIYNPALGRFMQTDPILYEAGTNIYAYVRGDPINLNDPDGKHESHWLLRLLVPGQVAWDDAVTAAEEGRWGAAAGSLTRMAGEIALTVVPAGRMTAAAESVTARMSTSATQAALNARASLVERVHTSTRNMTANTMQGGFRTNGAFGEAVGWGRGRQEALARIGQIDRETVSQMRDRNPLLTRDLVQGWRDHYRLAADLERGSGVSSARAALMDRILRNWQ